MHRRVRRRFYHWPNRYRYAGDGLLVCPAERCENEQGQCGRVAGCGDAAYALNVGFVGTLTLDDVWRAALAGLVYMAGAHLGALRFRASSEQLFRTVVMSVLVLSFVGLAIRRVYLPHKVKNSRSTRCVKPQMILVSTTAGMSEPAQSMVVAWAESAR